MKKINKNLFSIIIIFLLTIPAHFGYSLFPSNIMGVFFPVNESIWEHMKLLFTPTLLYSIFYVLINNKSSRYITASMISSLISILFYLIIYLPLDRIFSYTPLIAIVLLFISIVLQVYLTNYLESHPISKISGIALFSLILLMFSLLTIFPPKTFIFRDPITNCYGIKK